MSEFLSLLRAPKNVTQNDDAGWCSGLIMVSNCILEQEQGVTILEVVL